MSDLSSLCEPLQKSKVIIYADKEAYRVLDGHYPLDLLKSATPESFGTEFLSYTMSVKTVKDINEALEHIYINSSKHSECIVTENM